METVHTQAAGIGLRDQEAYGSLAQGTVREQCAAQGITLATPRGGGAVQTSDDTAPSTYAAFPDIPRCMLRKEPAYDPSAATTSGGSGLSSQFTRWRWFEEQPLDHPLSSCCSESAPAAVWVPSWLTASLRPRLRTRHAHTALACRSWSGAGLTGVLRGVLASEADLQAWQRRAPRDNEGTTARPRDILALLQNLDTLLLHERALDDQPTAVSTLSYLEATAELVTQARGHKAAASTNKEVQRIEKAILHYQGDPDTLRTLPAAVATGLRNVDKALQAFRRRRPSATEGPATGSRFGHRTTSTAAARGTLQGSGAKDDEEERLVKQLLQRVLAAYRKTAHATPLMAQSLLRAQQHAASYAQRGAGTLLPAATETAASPTEAEAEAKAEEEDVLWKAFLRDCAAAAAILRASQEGGREQETKEDVCADTPASSVTPEAIEYVLQSNLDHTTKYIEAGLECGRLWPRTIYASITSTETWLKLASCLLPCSPTASMESSLKPLYGDWTHYKPLQPKPLWRIPFRDWTLFQFLYALAFHRNAWPLHALHAGPLQGDHARQPRGALPAMLWTLASLAGRFFRRELTSAQVGTGGLKTNTALGTWVQRLGPNRYACTNRLQLFVVRQLLDMFRELASARLLESLPDASGAAAPWSALHHAALPPLLAILHGPRKAAAARLRRDADRAGLLAGGVPLLPPPHAVGSFEYHLRCAIATPTLTNQVDVSDAWFRAGLTPGSLPLFLDYQRTRPYGLTSDPNIQRMLHQRWPPRASVSMALLSASHAGRAGALVRSLDKLLPQDQLTGALGPTGQAGVLACHIDHMLAPYDASYLLAACYLERPAQYDARHSLAVTAGTRIECSEADHAHMKHFCQWLHKHQKRPKRSKRQRRRARQRPDDATALRLKANAVRVLQAHRTSLPLLADRGGGCWDVVWLGRCLQRGTDCWTAWATFFWIVLHFCRGRLLRARPLAPLLHNAFFLYTQATIRPALVPGASAPAPSSADGRATTDSDAASGRALPFDPSLARVADAQHQHHPIYLEQITTDCEEEDVAHASGER